MSHRNNTVSIIVPTTADTSPSSRQRIASTTSSATSEGSTTCPQSSILNLSNLILSQHQRQALELGLKFAPSPKEEPDLLEFFELFEQRCGWAFKRITGGNVPTLPQVMQDRLKLMKEKLGDLEHFEYPSNILPDVRKAILQLQKNKNIIIRQADKGSCTVIMDRDQYISEGEEHLSDKKIYLPSALDRTTEVCHKANLAVTHHHNLGVISRYHKNQIMMDVENVRTQQMYFLRKVHKHPHKLRPIVSACFGPTEKISGFMVKIFDPHLDDITSLVKNTTAVVNVLEGLDLGDSPDIILATFDVQSLYTSIPQGVGIEMVLQRISPTTPPTSRERPFKNMMRDLLKIILGDNHFSFHDKQYTQKKGVAMGTKCAPHLANLFMASLEEKALNSWEGTTPTRWLRFLDDILMIWKGSREELDIFHQHLNNQMAAIKFTMEASTESIVFLDLKIQKGSRFRQRGILDLQLHIKATNPQCFLHFSSCHPFQTFKTIIRGEIIRTLRCTSSQTVFITILERLFQKFRRRGYPEWLIRQQSEGINHVQREELLKPKERRSL